MKEQWKVIENISNYSVSNLGRVKNNTTQQILKNQLCGNTYLMVGLWKKKHITMTIHRLVAKAFIPNPLNKEQVNHIDGDKSNNRVDNLEWNTRSENEKHAFRIGLKSHKGEKHNKSILTQKDVDFIRKSKLKYVELAKKFKVHPATVSSLMRNKSWIV